MNNTRKGTGPSHFHTPGVTDYNGRLDGSFVPWSYDLRHQLLIRYPLPEGINPISDKILLEPKWTLSLQQDVSNGSDKVFLNGVHKKYNDVADSNHDQQAAHPLSGYCGSGPAAQYMTVTMEENRRMTPDTHWQDVRHLVFTGDSPALYEPGDVLTIYPKNNPEHVDQLIRRMDWTEIVDSLIQFAPTRLVNDGSLHPSPPITLSVNAVTTLRTLLTEHLDLTAIPRRSFFSLISHFTNDQFHKDRLLEFTKPEYIDELYDYTTRPRRSILEVLQEFESVKIPWQWAANTLPELRGRQFSIASGGQLKITPDGMARFELLVAIVKYKTVIKKIREGLCTRYLAGLPVGAQIRVTLQKGGLAITKAEAWRPVLMIGPGTGVAPMRSLIWERLQWSTTLKSQTEALSKSHVNGSIEIGPSVLFFGCRSQNADYFHHQEWENLCTKMPLEVQAAFSRDQSQKVYVQDLIKKYAEEVFRLIHQLSGIVYVCGSSGKMPQAVRAALAEVFRDHGGMDQETSERYLEAMEKDGRYKQETW